MIKNVFRILFPRLSSKIRTFLNYKRLKKEYLYDIKRYFKYSDYYYNYNEMRSIKRIIHRYHPIEKGITMPKRKLGFGEDNIINLVKDLKEFKINFLEKSRKKNNSSYQQFQHALNVLREYRKIHVDEGFNLEKKILDAIDSVLIDFDKNFSLNHDFINSDEYFKHSKSSFDLFSASRSSLRYFGKKIDLNDIIDAIEIAKNYPSACNRQPCKVHIIKNLDLKNQILQIQGGNRGFGHLANFVLIVSSDLSGYRGVNERNAVFVDGGIFSMNLLYSLHFKKVGACPLNWSNSNSNDLKLRELINLPNNQTVIMLIACGGIKGKIKIANSKKNKLIDTLEIHE